jgi:hypothetical protein
MTSWSTITWLAVRASGFTDFVLLTLAVLLGLALSMRWQRPAWPRLITNELHSFLTLLSLVFLVVHILAAWIDPFTRFGWQEVFIPFTSHYRPIYMALGIMGLYLALAVWISTQVRPWIGFAWWRRLHGLSFLAYLLALFHGIGIGSDTRTIWGIALYGGSALLVCLLLFIRLSTPIGARGRTYPKLAALTMLVLLGGAIWTFHGPLQSGWNAVANNGQGSGQVVGASSTSTTTNAAPQTTVRPFTASLQGSYTENGPDAAGNVSIQVSTTMSNGSTGTLNLTMQGQQAMDGSITVGSTQVTMALQGYATTYQGSATLAQSDGGEWDFDATLQASGQAQALQARIRLMPSGGTQMQGSVEVTPASA